MKISTATFFQVFAKRAPSKASKLAADHIYAQAQKASRLPVFYTSMGIEDSFEGRFEVFVAHIWLLSFKLNKDRDRGVLQALMDRVVKGFDVALREMGVGDLSVPRRIRTLVEALYARLEGYDNAYKTDVLLKKHTELYFFGSGNLRKDEIKTCNLCVYSYLKRMIDLLDSHGAHVPLVEEISFETIAEQSSQQKSRS